MRGRTAHGGAHLRPSRPAASTARTAVRRPCAERIPARSGDETPSSDLAGLRSLRGLALTGADGAGWEALLDLPALERVLLYGSVDPDVPEALRRRFPTARLEVRPVRHAAPRPGPHELPDGRWWIRADVRSLLGAEDNFEAEERLRSRLGQTVPALLDRLELDSEADSLGIIGPTEADIRRAMHVLGLG